MSPKQPVGFQEDEEDGGHTGGPPPARSFMAADTLIRLL